MAVNKKFAPQDSTEDTEGHASTKKFAPESTPSDTEGHALRTYPGSLVDDEVSRKTPRKLPPRKLPPRKLPPEAN